MRKQVLLITAIVTMLAASMPAENSNPRLGKWKLESEAPAPASNVMTYEPHGDHGMKITIDQVSKDGVKPPQ